MVVDRRLFLTREASPRDELLPARSLSGRRTGADPRRHRGAGAGQSQWQWRDQWARAVARGVPGRRMRSEEHTSELQSLLRSSYAVFCLKKITAPTPTHHTTFARTVNFTPHQE